jgi:heme O synthase-like polyprenyltransferase
MASEPLLAAYRMPVVEHGDSVRSNVLSNYWTLTKPEINFLICLATAAAFFVGCAEPLGRFPWGSLYTRSSGRSWLRAAQVH